MTKLERVITGLTIHNQYQQCATRSTRSTLCPYFSDDECVRSILRDALELLKEQEPRVLTLDEVKKLESLRDGAIWIETIGKGLFPALPEITMSEIIFFVAIPADHYRFYCENKWYGKTWRCWTYKPTDEQRKAVKWE